MIDMTISPKSEAERIRKLREGAGFYTQASFAQHIGMEPATYNRIEKHGEGLDRRRRKNLELIAKGLKMTVDELENLLREDDRQLKEWEMLPGKLQWIPVINLVAAGSHTEHTDLDYAVGHADYYTAIHNIGDPGAFGATVSGTSMQPDFQPGDIVVVSPKLADTVTDGDVCIIQFLPDYEKGPGQCLRKVYRTNGGQIVRLVATNPEYPEILVPRDQANAWPVVMVTKYLKGRKQLCASQ